MASSPKVWSYLIRVEKPLPNINSDKLKDLGIKLGPWIKEILKGNDVTVEDKLIKASDLLYTSNSYNRNVLIVDCNTLADLTSIREAVQQPDLNLIVHMAASELLNDRAYIEWMRTNVASDACIHLFMDESHANVDIAQVYRLQAKLNMTSERMFKMLPVQTQQWQRHFDEAAAREMKLRETSLKVVQARSGLTFHLKPKFMLDVNDDAQKIVNGQWCNEIFEAYENDIRLADSYSEADKHLLNELKKKVSNDQPSTAAETVTKYPNILFLGTASALPSPNRNISSIMLNIDASKSMLFDCGEATLSQLNKYYADTDEFDAALCGIKTVFVSHCHLDHFNGLFGLIKRRCDAFARLGRAYEKLVLIHPRPLNNELKGAAEIFFTSFSWFQNNMIVSMTNDLISQNKQLNTLGFNSIRTVEVEHIPFSYACVIELNNSAKSKIVYSGDCRPSKELIREGRNCDLLIHECTFEDSYKGEALAKKHSTISEALEVAELMNAKATLLTHFSQRYRYLTRVDDILEKEDKHKEKAIGLANDFMRYNLDDESHFEELRSLLGRMKVVFKEKLNEVELRRERRLAFESAAASSND